MAAITSQRWCHLLNAYEVKASRVCLLCKKLCDPYLSASEVSFHDGALYKAMYTFIFTV